MSRMYPEESLFTYEILFFLVFMAVSLIRRKKSLKNYVFATLLFVDIAVYVKEAFVIVQFAPDLFKIGAYFTKIPFGNLSPSFMADSIMGDFKVRIFTFFIITTACSLLFGVLLPGIFVKRVNLKMLYLFSVIGLELVQVLLMYLVYNGHIINGGAFDTGAYILAPLCLLLGFYIHKTLFWRKEASHD